LQAERATEAAIKSVYLKGDFPWRENFNDRTNYISATLVESLRRLC